MSINLTKGQKISLVKEGGSNESIRKVMVGLGWDEVPAKKGLFSFLSTKQDIDCDASAILCQNGKLVAFSKDVVFYNNLNHSTGAVVHQGDNLTGGDGQADDEQIFVDLAKLPTEYDKVAFVVTIYQARARKQHFGLIRNAFIRVCDATTGVEICRYNLADDYNGSTALVVGELQKTDGQWKFVAVGQGTNDDGIVSISNRYI